MALQHDDAGFLVGKVIKTQEQVLTSQQDGVRILTRIRADVASIARALSVQSKTQARNTRTGPGGLRSGPVASTSGRSDGRTVGGNRTASAAATSVRRSSATVAVSARDSQGRFLPRVSFDDKGGERGDVAARSSDGRFSGKGDSGGGKGSVNGGLARLTAGMGRLSASLASADNLDPTVNAMKEVTDVVSPLGRGLFSMFGRSAERKKERWYNRIWTALKDKKQGATQTAGAARGGLLGGLAGGSPAGGLLGMAGRGLMGGAGGLLKGGGKLLKRIPLLGALIGGGLALGSAFGMDDDPTKTPEENRARRYKGAGEGAGMMVGGAAGAVLGSVLGPVGTVVGGYLGGLLGEKVGGAVGEWTKELMDSDLPGRIEAGWSTFTVGLSASWDSLTTDAKAQWSTVTATAGEWWTTTRDAASKIMDSVSGAANVANDWIKQKTGVDVKSSVSSGWEAAKSWGSDKASQAADAARSVGAAMVPNTIKRAITAGADAAVQAKAGYDEKRGNQTDAPAPRGGLQSAARAAGGATGAAANWVLGKTSERYESGGKGAGTVSTGAGDFGGASYGTYQLASKTGTLDKFFKSTEYGKKFEGMKVGSTEFNAKWKEVAQSDPKFGGAQHDFIKATHYNPAMSGLKAAGIDLSGHGAAVQDALWSTSVQFGAGSAKKGNGAIGMFVRALAGRDASKMTGAEVVAALQDHKATNNDKLFASSSAAVRAGTLNRAASEKAALLRLDVANAALPSPAAAGVPAAVPANLPEQAKNGVPAPGALGPAAGAKVQVSLKDKTSQNIGDRGIAHIVTGGIGSA